MLRTQWGATGIRATAVLAGLALATLTFAADDTSPSSNAVHFEAEIRPVLAATCVQCHGPHKQEGELRLDSRKAILRGGSSGPAIVPGKPDESLLIEALKHQGLEMPPDDRLAAKTVHEFERWIAEDATWPSDNGPIRPQAQRVTEEDRQWWAFLPPRAPPVPGDETDTWSRTPIDRFVMRRLNEHGMRPARPADKATLARRLYFDLIGLPPTPEQLDDFLNDSSPDAWEELIDQLLHDERYGEHWARYWLDIVRYSESDGWNQDAFRPQIWRYRDYVVKAFNDDKPYPAFVREQLAGDEIMEDDPEHLAAAGFLRLGVYEYNQRDARGHWNDIINEVTDVAGDVFLGIGVACARCHDHKFDPVLQRDYFALRAFFEPLNWRDDLPAARESERREYSEQYAIWKDATKNVRQRIDSLTRPYHDRKWKSTVAKFPLEIQACFHKPDDERTSWEAQMAYLVSRQFLEEGGGPLKDLTKEDRKTHEQLQKELSSFDDLKPSPLPRLMTVTDFAGSASPTHIPSDRNREVIAPSFLTVLVRHADEAPLTFKDLPNSTGRRSALARWIGSDENPLTTRVIVNRIWQQHFGQGIVRTANNFGRTGQFPTHPELLDWLTVDFVQNGWSIKRLHKQILLSAVWCQSSHHRLAAQYQEKDPAEGLLWRAPIRRLTAEQIRDAMLSVSGELRSGLGGPSVDEQTPRRALYVKRFRNTTDTFLHAFDAANGLKSVAERNNTTTPTQSLLLINGDYSLGRARKLADRLEQLTFSDPADTLTYAARLAWSREPTSAELHQSLRFLRAQDPSPIAHEKLVDYCHVLFNSNKFLYLD